MRARALETTNLDVEGLKNRIAECYRLIREMICYINANKIEYAESRQVMICLILNSIEETMDNWSVKVMKGNNADLLYIEKEFKKLKQIFSNSKILKKENKNCKCNNNTEKQDIKTIKKYFQILKEGKKWQNQ